MGHFQLTDIDCPYSQFLDNTTDSCKTCSEINPGLKYDALLDSCVEVCGKGYNLGQFECDDGNTLNGDGCNQFCEIETDWALR